MNKIIFSLIVVIFIVLHKLAFASQANIFGEDPYYSTKKDNIAYFDDLEMKNIYNYYPNVTKTDAKILILDTAFYPNHQDYGINGDAGHVKYYHQHKSGEKTSHGTSVAGIIGSKIGNNIGYRGLIQSNTIHKGSFVKSCKSKIEEDQDDCYSEFIDYLINKEQYDIINISQLLGYYNYGKYIQRVNNPSLSDYIENEFDLHLSSIQYYRNVFSKYPNKLFIIGAGNSDIGSVYENGAIHVDSNKRFRPLANVIIAGAYQVKNSTKTLTQNSGLGIDFIANEEMSVAEYHPTNTNYYRDGVTGTSLTAPQVTSVAAMVYDTCSKMQGNNITSIKMIMNQSGFDTITKDGKTYKILNAYKAVKKATEVCNQ